MSSLHRLATALIATATLLLAVPAVAAPAPAAPVAASTAGINDWSCRPSAAHPRPVVLLHGLLGTGPGNWAHIAPALAQAGHCVFHLSYGQTMPGLPVAGIGPLRASADEIEAFIDRVLRTTGVEQVDLVGHSEGGFLTLYLAKVRGLGPKIGSLVAMSPPTRGAAFAGLATLGEPLGLTGPVARLLVLLGCEACHELVPGGPAVRELNDGPVTVVGPRYTIITSTWDVLVPPAQAVVREEGVRNQLVQSSCPLNPVGHIGMAFDATVTALVIRALDTASSAPVTCSFGLPL